MDWVFGGQKQISWCCFEVWLQDSTPFPAQLMKQRRNFKGRSAVFPASGGEWFPSVSFREKNEEFILSYLPRFDAHQMIYQFLVMTIYLVDANKNSLFHWFIIFMYTIFTNHLIPSLCNLSRLCHTSVTANKLLCSWLHSLLMEIYSGSPKSKAKFKIISLLLCYLQPAIVTVFNPFIHSFSFCI